MTLKKNDALLSALKPPRTSAVAQAVLQTPVRPTRIRELAW